MSETDAPCQVDATGYCSRHQRTHAGRELYWALDGSAKGEAYRRLWDERPLVNQRSTKALVTARAYVTAKEKLKSCQHRGRAVKGPDGKTLEREY
jgi:hypothetical protein